MNPTPMPRLILALLLATICLPGVALAEGRLRMFDLESQTEAHFDLMAPGYFLFGMSGKENEQVRFRLPVRYRFADYNPGKRSKVHGYFAFTQDAFWNLYEDSAPFYDSKFEPEAYIYFLPWNWMVAGAVGVRHQSNGRDGDFSRSWNRMYATIAFGDPSKNAFYGKVEAWKPWGVAEDNDDILDFAGRGEASLVFVPGALESPTLFGGDNLSLHVRLGLFGKKVFPKVETTLVFRFWNEATFAPSVMAQYFHGTDHILRDFDREYSVFRLGLGIATHASMRMR